MPSTLNDAYGLLYSSIFDPNPVVFIENRWLHNQEGDLPATPDVVPLGKARVLREGKDISLIAYSYMALEALRAANYLTKLGIDAEVVDLRTIAPTDWPTVEASVQRTGRLLALDTSTESFSIASEVVAHCASRLFQKLKSAPQKLGSPHAPVPTSVGLSKQFYPGAPEIVEKVLTIMGVSKTHDMRELQPDKHDVPGAWFTGPF
jgi:pyruvate/2-oxoglutarate/acetoin dehydrogenase E1 component